MGVQMDFTGLDKNQIVVAKVRDIDYKVAKIFINATIFTLDCRFNCDKDGTIGGFCEKENGFCQCKDGFHGEKCDKGKIGK